METLTISPERVGVEWNGRRYGFTGPLEEKFLQPIPRDFERLADVGFRDRSSLLRLEGDERRQKRAILDAYARDLALLNQRIAEFEACVRQAIRCATITGKKHPNGANDAQQVWDMLQQEIPPVGDIPLIELSHTRAAKQPEVLLTELNGEFASAVDRSLMRFTFWLHRLVEKELVGLVDWLDSDVCRYHYFRHELTEKAIREETRTEHHVDRSQPYGWQTEDRTLRNRTILREQFRERHVHHLMDAKLHELGEYQEPVPRRIRVFLNSVPQWLTPSLRIVDGQITMEEILRRKIGEEITVESEVLAVYKYSPAVLLGPFNLIGWSGDEPTATEVSRRVSRFFQKLFSR